MASPALGTSLIVRLETQNTANAGASLASTIGEASRAVKLEDISAPRCFEVEERLLEALHEENAAALTVR